MKKPRLLWAVSLLLALACTEGTQENKNGGLGATQQRGMAAQEPPCQGAECPQNDAGLGATQQRGMAAQEPPCQGAECPQNDAGLGGAAPQTNKTDPPQNPDAGNPNKNPGGLGDTVPQKNQAQPNQAKTLDPRTPADFARAWAEVKRTPDFDEQADKAMALGKAWKGLRLRWTGAALAELCLDAKRTCAANPFEKNTTPDHFLLGGLFPLVSFTEEAWAKLKQGCQGQPVCVVTFEAELSDITTDPDVPLNLQFTGAQVTEARAPKPEENWFARPELKLPAESKRPPKVGKPSPPVDLSKLKPKTF